MNSRENDKRSVVAWQQGEVGCRDVWSKETQRAALIVTPDREGGLQAIAIADGEVERVYGVRPDHADTFIAALMRRWAEVSSGGGLVISYVAKGTSPIPKNPPPPPPGPVGREIIDQLNRGAAAQLDGLAEMAARITHGR